MSIATNIAKLRQNYNMSQERFAEILMVSRQAVQKWESGASQPDIENLSRIAKYFNVSIDALVLDSNKRIAEELKYDKKIQPEFASMQAWESYSMELLTEYRQCIDEGLDITQYKELFEAVAKMPQDERKEKISSILFDIAVNAPTAKNYKYCEPSSLDEIKNLRPHFDYGKNKITNLKSRIYGAWVGRICGCLLGKPIECIRTEELRVLLKESDNFPMHRYIKSTDITEEMCQKFKFSLKNKCYADTVQFAPVDDDTNYTILAQVLINKYGMDFTPFDVSRIWLDYQPKNAYCTAERVAFCNFVKGYTPPHSAMYKNPYREWIGAQIRGDYFGYINPGNPELAAEMAWRDASISHIKNGIYGEMFVAAMIAVAAVSDDIKKIILGGAAQIPSTSRLYEAISMVVYDYEKGVGQYDCFANIHRMYDEHNSHDWCHTISNAMIVTASLLYGNGDYGNSICMAVQTGFDTDCNGATVGSILGMRNGIEGIGKEWTAPINDELDTSIFGVGKVKISDAADATLKHIEMLSKLL